jgi:hypothetical protein
MPLDLREQIACNAASSDDGSVRDPNTSDVRMELSNLSVLREGGGPRLRARSTLCSSEDSDATTGGSAAAAGVRDANADAAAVGSVHADAAAVGSLLVAVILCVVVLVGNH